MSFISAAMTAEGGSSSLDVDDARFGAASQQHTDPGVESQRTNSVGGKRKLEVSEAGGREVDYEEWSRRSMPQPPLFVVRQLCLEAAERRAPHVREGKHPPMENQLYSASHHPFECGQAQNLVGRRADSRANFALTRLPKA
mmetsp:Transcript_12524/g.29604  ORF Transcript_12524/g.29604 Transcript_12524/m.29604 type:complete len:141 (+) Transcript_12524:286-708(+)|eukprot:2131869-Rhodomonas_salina.1